MPFTDVNPKGRRKKGGGKKRGGGGEEEKRKKDSSNNDSQMLKYFPVFLVVCQVSLGCVNELVPGKF